MLKPSAVKFLRYFRSESWDGLNIGSCICTIDADAEVLSIFLNSELYLILPEKVTVNALLKGFLIRQAFPALQRNFAQARLQIAVEVPCRNTRITNTHNGISNARNEHIIHPPNREGQYKQADENCDKCASDFSTDGVRHKEGSKYI